MAPPLKPIARRALAAQSDERLVRLLREGHDPAFDEIVRRYRGPLVAFAAAITGAGRAEDVVQAALMRAHRALSDDDREIRLRPWLFAIVRNGALNSVRDDPTWSELDPALHGASDEAAATAEQREDLGRLVDAICALPASQRQALVMREMEGVGHAEIAAKLKTSPTAVRGLIFRARTTLRNALGALVPLPILRWLLEDGAVTAAAGAAAGTAATAGAGGGGVLAGGVFGKALVGLTAAVVAVGAGKAIDDRRSGDDRPGSDPAAAQAASAGSGGDGSGSGGGSDPDDEASGGPAPPVESRDQRGEERGERRLAGEDRGGREAGSAGVSGGSGGSGGGGGGGHDPSDDDDDSSDSGSGGGHGDSDDDFEDDDSSGGDDSGGDGGQGHSGDDDDVDEPEDDFEEAEVDDGDSDSDSGSGSSGSGSDD